MLDGHYARLPWISEMPFFSSLTPDCAVVSCPAGGASREGTVPCSRPATCSRGAKRQCPRQS